MLVVRKEGKAHDRYNSFRSTFEILEAVGREPQDCFKDAEGDLTPLQKLEEKMEKKLEEKMEKMKELTEKRVEDMEQRMEQKIQQQKESIVNSMQQQIDDLRSENELLRSKLQVFSV